MDESIEELITRIEKDPVQFAGEHMALQGFVMQLQKELETQKGLLCDANSHCKWNVEMKNRPQKELEEIKAVITGRGDCVTKVLKCGDIISRKRRGY